MSRVAAEGEKMPKVSIVIPVHNVQDHLSECLESVTRQTLTDIEIICIDDNSSDDSPSILRRYAESDSRVRVITYTENRTASQARKDGVLSSSGDYIMFVDSDDSLEPHACELLSSELARDPVDILHFGTKIVAELHITESRLVWMREFMTPCAVPLTGEEILRGAFAEERLYNFSLWDKIYSADVAKMAFSRVQDGPFPKAQDKYAYFLLAYFANTYRGLPDAQLYRYHFGRGVTGHNLLTLTHFERYCSMARVADAIESFLSEENALDRYRVEYSIVRDQLLRDCVWNWKKHLRTSDRAAGFDLMLEYWERAEVIGKVAALKRREQGRVARLLSTSSSLARSPRPTQVVGTFYHRYANGGVQRNLSHLIKLWRELGYAVVLFTDTEPSAEDYDLPSDVVRIVLPAPPADPKAEYDYTERSRVLQSAIDAHGVDVMVYHAWVSNILIWDLITCRAAGAAFVVHCHSVFAQPMRNARAYFADMPYVYRLSDAVVTLSEVDRRFWGSFNGNTIVTANPLTFDPALVETAALDSDVVLWLGRMSDEKRPHDALRIFAKVLDGYPDATFIMVGDCANEAYMAGLDELVDELRIRDNVEMAGFHKDVLPFYRRASVVLMTSEFEGFPLTLAECQTAGVPCVMYELPYLTMVQESKGLVAVEQGDTDAAADAIVSLMKNPQRRKAMGVQARENIESISRFDFAGTWQGLFERVSEGPAPQSPIDESTRVMWDTLFEHYRVGAKRRSSETKALQKRLSSARRKAWKGRRARKRLKRLRKSWSYRIGRAITFIPRLIARPFKKTKKRVTP